MGKDRTSVGPLASIHFSFSVVMVATSTSRTVSSVAGCRRIRRITKRHSCVSATTSTPAPDSSRTSTFMVRPTPIAVVRLVGRDDAPDQLVPDDVLGREGHEGDVAHALEDVGDDAEPTGGAAGEVDLGNVAGDDHLGAETEPGEEHLHLLRRGVL